MKCLMFVLSCVTISTSLHCSETGASITPVPRTPPIAIPQAPWRTDVNGSSDLEVLFHLKKVGAETLKERAEHAEKVRAEQLRKELEEKSSSEDESGTDDKYQVIGRMSHLTSPLENNQ